MLNEIKKKLQNLPELLTIGQVSEIFGIHQDTLRNWEKDGILVPLRVGKRQDRKYRPQDIERIVEKMGSKLTLQQLEQFLWRSADILRGKIDSSDYKKYIFGLLFYKRISDVWDEEYEATMEQYHDKELAKADYNHRFQVPEDCRWGVITEQAENIGQKLNDIFDKLTNANSPKLDKIFDDLDFANKDRFPNETLQKLINHFSQYNFNSNYISSDLLGDAYEYLIKQFAAAVGKKGGEFYTPREVERVIINILKPHQKDHIYDCCVGSGGFLLEAYNYLKNKSGEKIAKTLYFNGQEINIGTFAIAKINMFLHGLDSSDIRRGDTLANPQFLKNDGSLQTFDITVTNPPYSIKDWEDEIFKTNKYGRLENYDMPPKSNADYAFVLHIIKSMNANGRAGIVLPHGVLFRGGSEGRIREQIIKNDLIDAIVGLPAKLFYGAPIPAVILFLNKNKPEHKKNKIIFIASEKDYLEGKNQNSLRQKDIDKIVQAYDNYKNIDKYCRVVDLREVEEKNFNLNVEKYVNSNNLKEDKIDVNEIKTTLGKLQKEEDLIDQGLNILLNIIESSDKITKWKIVKLRDVAEFSNGKAHEKFIDENGKYILINSKFISTDGEIIKRTNENLSPLYINDIAMVMSDVPNGKALAKCFFIEENGKYTLNQRICSIRAKNINARFLFYILNRNKYFLNFDNGVGQTNLRRDEVLGCPILIPPLEEQKEIVDILLKVDYKIKINEQIKNRLSQLKKGLMQDLLSGRVRV